MSGLSPRNTWLRFDYRTTSTTTILDLQRQPAPWYIPGPKPSLQKSLSAKVFSTIAEPALLLVPKLIPGYTTATGSGNSSANVWDVGESHTYCSRPWFL